jgi:hypothetical protein
LLKRHGATFLPRSVECGVISERGTSRGHMPLVTESLLCLQRSADLFAQSFGSAANVRSAQSAPDRSDQRSLLLQQVGDPKFVAQLAPNGERVF